MMEVGCDYNLFFWHCTFGNVGTMSDLNIWDCSLLYKELTAATFELIVLILFTKLFKLDSLNDLLATSFFPFPPHVVSSCLLLSQLGELL